MDESAKIEQQQDTSSSDAVALTRQALQKTRKNLRDSDELLHRSRAMREAEDSPTDDERP